MTHEVVLTRRNLLAKMGMAIIAMPCRPCSGVFAAACDRDYDLLPLYWRTYLDGIVRKLNAHGSSDGFYFVTDMHFPSNNGHAGQVLAYLSKRTAIRRVLFGGDIPEAFSQGKYKTPKDGLDACARLYRDHLVNPVESAGLACYAAKGNHDFTMLDSPDDSAGYTYDAGMSRSILLGTNTAARIATNGDDTTCCYYYFDNADARVRYIVADTTEETVSGNVSWGVQTGMSARQLHWIAREALGGMMDGYAAVVVHHIPVAPVVSLEKRHFSFEVFRQLLEAYQLRGHIAIEGREYDYSNAKGRILLDVSGHAHAERLTFYNGILHLTEPADYRFAGVEFGSSPWCGPLPDQETGTITEQTLGAFQLDLAHNVVRIVRIGGGSDREIRLTPRLARVGERLKFDAGGFPGRIHWACYDADKADRVANPKSKYCPLVRYHNDCGRMDGDVLVARKPGNVIVLAMNERYDKLVFLVTITK